LSLRRFFPTVLNLASLHDQNSSAPADSGRWTCRHGVYPESVEGQAVRIRLRRRKDLFTLGIPVHNIAGMQGRKEREMSEKGQGIYIAVSAPSGAGKTSICKRLMKMFPEIRYSVSYTTRPPRRREQNGKDYVFISDEDFRERIKKGGFVEWAENYGHLYGTPRETMDAFLLEGYDLLFDVDPRGARALKESYPDGIFVFVLPPSLEVLKERLKGRGSEPEEALRKRLEKVRDEIKEIFWYDYVIFNEQIEEAVERLQAIYLAEKSRRARLTNRIKHFIE
jgi:guanylate kinase